jgi:hypothetical protein
MYCSICSEPVSDTSVRYCTRCGHGFVGNDRLKRGLRQGVVLFIIGLILIPVWLFIPMALPPSDKLVESAPSTTVAESLAWIMMWMAFIAAVGRIGYALLFWGGSPPKPSERSRLAELPSADSFEPAPKAGSWRSTKDLVDAGLRKPHTSGDLR